MNHGLPFTSPNPKSDSTTWLRSFTMAVAAKSSVVGRTKSQIEQDNARSMIKITCRFQYPQRPLHEFQHPLKWQSATRRLQRRRAGRLKKSLRIGSRMKAPTQIDRRDDECIAELGRASPEQRILLRETHPRGED